MQKASFDVLKAQVQTFCCSCPDLPSDGRGAARIISLLAKLENDLKYGSMPDVDACKSLAQP
eukprot:11171470-Karenia_brevis.AAC.1